jgi:hypothetical protein
LEALEGATDSAYYIVDQLFDIDAGFAAFEAGSNPRVKFEGVLPPALVSVAFQRAMHELRMKLIVLRTRQTIVQDRLLQAGLEVCRVASVCLGFQSVVRILAGCPSARVSGHTDRGISLRSQRKRICLILVILTDLILIFLEDALPIFL